MNYPHQAPFHESRKLHQFLVRVPKNFAYFTYFILESLEGSAFYSTIDSKDQTMRNIQIQTTPEFSNQILKILNDLKQRFPLVVENHLIIQE